MGKINNETQSDDDTRVTEDVKIIIPKMRESGIKPANPADYIIFIIIGTIISLINIKIIYLKRDEPGPWEIWSYLIIIFMVMIPGIFISLTKRPRGYAYHIGYAVGGLIEVITGDFFIGGYVIIVDFFLFTIEYLIFFKIWRAFSKLKPI